jgi:hypothetical protein
MADAAKPAPKFAKFGEAKIHKYPSEDETFVRRIGSAVLTLWPSLPPEMQEKILAEANQVWDREYNVPGLHAKLEAYVKRRR